MASPFEVDRLGLRKILERRGKEYILRELVQNGWDQNVTYVKVTFTKPTGSRVATLVVEDDDPEGFADLSHAYTLFAESAKKRNPQQRGRFNIGEKLVIAACEESRIVTTKGGVAFTGNERHTLRQKTERGSRFEGTIRMTNDEFVACCEAMRCLIPPAGIETYFNGELVPPREPIAIVQHVSLLTEDADQEGFLRRVTRSTEIHVHALLPGETGMLFEMGIPVVETGDDWHVDIQQKVPINLDRDSVPPAYLRTIRTKVLNEVHDKLDQESANHLWVKAAMEDPDVSEGAVQSVIRQRFGDKVVTYDPNDPEANSRAVSEGFVVIHGRQLAGREWDNVRKVAGLAPTAGSVFPTDPGKVVPMEPLEPTEQEAKMVSAIKRIGHRLIGHDVEVVIVSNRRDTARARYGSRVFMCNRAWLGKRWFEALDEESVQTIIHEFGHEFERDHLSERYYRALTRLGARLAIATAQDPSLLVL